MIPRVPFRLETEGIRMDVLALGQGAPVLLIHGFTASKEAWFFNYDAFAAQHYVLAMDLPGYGQSTKVAPPDPIPFYAEWLVRLLDYQGHASAHVVGSSMGGAVAMQLALSHPKRVRKLVLVDALGLGSNPDGAMLERLIGAHTREEVVALMERVVFDPKMVLPQAVERSLHYRQTPGVSDLLRRVGSKLSDGTRALVDFRPRLKEIAAPTLVVWGKEDRLIPAQHAEAARAIPNVRIHLFDKCGHLPQLEHAQAFNALVTGFLR